MTPLPCRWFRASPLGISGGDVHLFVQMGTPVDHPKLSLLVASVPPALRFPNAEFTYVRSHGRAWAEPSTG